MALTVQQIGALVRNRLNLPVSERLRLQSLVSDALTRLSDKVALDASERHLLMTRGTETVVAVAGGSADLSALINSAPFINLNRIQCGTIRFRYDLDRIHPYPCEWVDRQQLGLAANTDDLFVSIFLDGTTLCSTDNTLSGTFEMSVPFVPTVANLPDALRDHLIDKVVELAAMSGDLAEDGKD